MPNLVYIGPLILLQKRTFKPVLQSQKDEALCLHKDVFYTYCQKDVHIRGPSRCKFEFTLSKIASWLWLSITLWFLRRFISKGQSYILIKYAFEKGVTKIFNKIESPSSRKNA